MQLLKNLKLPVARTRVRARSALAFMNFADCYSLLGLTSGASTAQIKASYRRLARQYHPDVNPDDELASEKFIKLTEAYNILLAVTEKVSEASSHAQQDDASRHQPPATKVTRKETPRQNNPELSLDDQKLKRSSYQQLQQLLKSRRFARAIALVEALAGRFPQDIEVRQWQAIAYSSWGRELVNQKQLDKARIYLKKALRTDPHNRSLWTEVERDFRRIEQMF